MKTLFVHNPTAGDGTPTGDTLKAILSAAGLSLTYCSKDEDDYKAALGKLWDLIVVAGGDGTVGKSIRHLPNRSIPLGILPTGTANNVARSLELRGRPERLAAQIGAAGRRPLDIGLANGPFGERRFIEAVGLGAVVPAVDPNGVRPPVGQRIRRGREALAKSIREARPQAFSVSLDGETIEGEFLFVEVLNLRFSGPRLPIAFFAEAGDQLLDVVFLEKERRDDMLDWILGEPERMAPPVKFFQARRVSIPWKNTPLRLDDRTYDPPDEESTVEISVEPDSLQVLHPGANAELLDASRANGDGP